MQKKNVSLKTVEEFNISSGQLCDSKGRTLFYGYDKTEKKLQLTLYLNNLAESEKSKNISVSEKFARDWVGFITEKMKSSSDVSLSKEFNGVKTAIKKLTSNAKGEELYKEKILSDLCAEIKMSENEPQNVFEIEQDNLHEVSSSGTSSANSLEEDEETGHQIFKPCAEGLSPADKTANENLSEILDILQQMQAHKRERSETDNGKFSEILDVLQQMRAKKSKVSTQ